MDAEPCAMNVVYDITRDGYSGWVGIGLGLAFMLCAAVCCVARRYFRPANLRFMPCLFIPLSCCWIILWILHTVPGHLSLRSALQRGHCAVVEGVITNFQPMPSTGHGAESFTVNGVHFSYSDFIITPGFHRTNYRKGPVSDGLHVRIHYRGQDIARLEIAEEITY